MNSSPLIPVHWQPRRIPLEPAAVAARGPVAERLVERLLTGEPDVLARLRGGAGDDVVLILGTAADLPWVDGAIYLGQDATAPGLYLPTAAAPDVPLPLLQNALRRAVDGQESTPFAVLPEWNLLLPLVNIRPLGAEWLRQWLNRGVKLDE